MTIFVITEPELGWDCVCKAYYTAKSEEEALNRHYNDIKSNYDEDYSFDDFCDTYVCHEVEAI